MSECACFASALQVSEQLHRTEAALSSTSFDQVLNISRWASAVCRQYAACAVCADPSYLAIYVIILRKAVACYSHLANSSSTGSSGGAGAGGSSQQGSSPGTASTASSTASSHVGGQGATRLRIGAFEVEAPLDDHTRVLILRTEVHRASDTAVMLENVFGPCSIKAAGRRGDGQARDDASLAYQRQLVAGLREQITAVERYLQAA